MGNFVKSYKELLVWQKSFDLVLLIYALMKDMPSDEKFGLTSQIKRSAISVPSNIAEGYGRKSQKSFSQFLKIARGSLLELETQLMLANKLNLIEVNKDIFNKTEEVAKMLNSFINKIDNKLKLDK